jgi:hypothetical protein
MSNDIRLVHDGHIHRQAMIWGLPSTYAGCMHACNNLQETIGWVFPSTSVQVSSGTPYPHLAHILHIWGYPPSAHDLGSAEHVVLAMHACMQ